MPVSMKNQSFLGKLGMVEATEKIFKKIDLFFDDVAIVVYVTSIEASSGFLL